MTTARHLLVLYTGGTLGMVPTDDGWAPGADLAGWLEALVAEHLPGLQYDLVELDPLIDSSNATPASWQRICDAVTAHRDTHGAFVVLHGTDTMGFSAAAASFALSGTGTPVVFTGAQRSLVRADSDAPANVRWALRAALDERLQQVGLFFDDRLVVGHHATKVSTSDDHAFESMNAAPMAQVVGDDLVFTPGATLATPLPPRDAVAPYQPVDLAVVTLYPGLSADRLRAMLTPAPRAVVLRAYGAGNAPDDDPSLAQVLADAAAAGTVLVVTTQCPHGAVHLGEYATSQPLLRAGAVAGGDFTTDALVAWLTFLFSQGLGPDEVREQVRSATA